MLVDGLAIAAGVVVVALTVLSAVSTVVVPRGIPVRLTRVVFLVMRRLISARRRLARSSRAAEHVLAFYAPMSLLATVVTWLVLVLGGFTLVFWGLGIGSIEHAYEASGSAMTTLGFVPVHGAAQQSAAFAEAGLGLFLLALLITYLPSMYAAFQRREVLVGLGFIQAGAPPTGVELLVRFHRIRGLEALEDQVWDRWTQGFVDIEESHTSSPALPFFRSPVPERSWITAAGAVLDGASLLSSTVDAPHQPAADLCIRAGYVSLRRVADYFSLPYDPAPVRGDAISVTRAEWEAARDELGAAGVPLRADVEEAWLDFSGWRVNYDAALVGLAALVNAPPAPWSSDRMSPRRHHPPVLRRATKR